MLLRKAYESQLTQVTDMLEGKIPSYDRETEEKIKKTLEARVALISKLV